MKLKSYLLISLTVIAFLFNSLTAAAFSINAKIAYLEKLKKQANDFIDQGRYDESIELSRKIKELSNTYKRLLLISKKWYQLERRIKVAKQVNGNNYAPKEYSQAVKLLKLSELNIISEDYDAAEPKIEEGLRLAEMAIQISKEKYEAERNKPTKQTKTTKNQPKVKAQPKPKIEVVKLNDYYLVRLIPSKRDALWRIAEYGEVYDDPWKWKLIYHANKNIIKDPDLIYPGQKLIIPPEDIDFDEED